MKTLATLLALHLAALSHTVSAGETFTLPDADRPLAASAVPAWADPGEYPDIITDLNALRIAYPGQIIAIEKRPKGIYLHLAEGVAILYDDGIPKTPEQAIENADIQDSLSQIYPLTPVEKRIPAWFDPGRARSEPLLKALFGADKASVGATAKGVEFCGRRIQFSGRQNAAEQLAKVARDLDAEIAKDRTLRPYVTSLGGTINWRFISGTKRLSAHSWGAAIDLNPELGAYWKWTPKADLASYPRHRFPQVIIDTFERHGFIWGGKWFHFDLMHFEYRPEIIEKAKRSAAVEKP